MLALTKKIGYGLIAMSHLARLDDGQVVSAREIAETFGVPASLLMNVLKELAAAGFVESVRGARGGYRLARPADRITMADLVRVLEGPIRLASCISGMVRDNDGDLCPIIDKCPICDPVHRVHRKIFDFMKQMTLAEIAEPENTPVKEDCLR